LLVRIYVDVRYYVATFSHILQNNLLKSWSFEKPGGIILYFMFLFVVLHQQVKLEEQVKSLLPYFETGEKFYRAIRVMVIINCPGNIRSILP